jgi:hypothetical protein
MKLMHFYDDFEQFANLGGAAAAAKAPSTPAPAAPAPATSQPAASAPLPPTPTAQPISGAIPTTPPPRPTPPTTPISAIPAASIQPRVAAPANVSQTSQVRIKSFVFAQLTLSNLFILFISRLFH